MKLQLLAIILNLEIKEKVEYCLTSTVVLDIMYQTLLQYMVVLEAQV